MGGREILLKCVDHCNCFVSIHRKVVAVISKGYSKIAREGILLKQ
jgi:hypothetical protein